MAKSFLKLLVVFMAMLGTPAAWAGTLDNAPFRVVLPDGNWKLDDSAAREMGKDVYLVASITGTNLQLKSVVIRADNDGKDSDLDETCAGMRDQLSTPAVKTLTDEATTFLGCKARHFVYEINGTVYNEAVVFQVGKAAWTIACVGPLAQKTAVVNMLTFYQKTVK
jgi:hypothetical protein